jgi:hypothetical protein
MQRLVGKHHDSRDANRAAYEDANDGNFLRIDPACKTACERLPLLGEDLTSQPTMSRLENAPRRSERYRMAQALLETFLASYDQVPKAMGLDLDDTDDEVHEAQQQALFHGYHDAYGYVPPHLYEGQSGQSITSILRPGQPTFGARDRLDSDVRSGGDSASVARCVDLASRR